MNQNDSASYITATEEAKFNLTFSMVPESIAQLLTKEKIANDAVMILKVKKPDYLGDSMWEFRFESRSITAKILDEAWLHQFQSRQIDVRPGDALKANMRIEVEYGHDGEVLGIHHQILRVIDTIPGGEDGQTNLLPSSE